MPLHILLVYDCIYPESLGGVEHRNYNLAAALAKRGHRITLAGWVKNPHSPCDGVTILPMPCQSGLYDAAGKRGIFATLKFARACLALDLRPYDVIETANIPYLHIVPLAFKAALRRKPLVVTWHEYFGPLWRDYKAGLGAYLFMAVEWLCAQLGDAVNGVSALTTARLSKHRLMARSRWDALQIKVISNGVDLAAIRAAAAAPAPPVDLLYAGRLMQEKRLDLLLRAVALIADKTIRLTIIGDGPDRARLEALTASLGLTPQVTYLGRLPDITDMWRHLTSATLAVQPSSREGFGMFALEAMALGVPVVYCESPDNAMKHIVRDGQDGFCVSPDPQTLASMIEKLLHDPQLRLTLSRNAKARAENYDWSAIAYRIERLFEAAR